MAKEGSPEAEKINDLIAQKKAADSEYKEFRTKINTVSKILGKRVVHGPQDAINFINGLEPEDITRKLFTKKSNLLGFFQKEFPEEMEVLKGYQKSELRRAASDKEGNFVASSLFKNVDKLEPEVQKILFSPEQLNKLKSADTYISAFPKNFNPSGTSGMTAFRELYEKPIRAVAMNARDLAS